MTAAPHVHEQFLIKAKLFLNLAMDSSTERTDEERQLWAALALELLGKWALGKHSPALIADLTEDGTQLLRAVGVLGDQGHFTTARASTIFKRCGKAFRPFNAEEAIKIANGRNEYLHGAELGFTKIPRDVWWARYWAQATILITAHSLEIADLVGHTREAEVKDHLARNHKNIEDRVVALIAAAKQRLALYLSGRLSAREHGEWESKQDQTAGLSHHTLAPCPACDYETGVLEGEDVIDRRISWDSDDEPSEYGPSFYAEVASDHFSCPRCHLVLAEYEQVEEAGVDGSFEVEADPDDFYEPDYGND